MNFQNGRILPKFLFDRPGRVGGEGGHPGPPVQLPVELLAPHWNRAGIISSYYCELLDYEMFIFIILDQEHRL